MQLPLLNSIVSEVSKFPLSHTKLIYTNNFHLLCMIMLSIRCRDENVNKFAAEFINNCMPIDILSMSVSEIESKLKNINIYKNKSISLKEIAKYFYFKKNNDVFRYNDLINIYLIGRKTAHVFLNIVYFNKKNFFKIGVDTHVIQICEKVSKHNFNSQQSCEKYIEDCLGNNIKLLKRAHETLVFFNRVVNTSFNKCIICKKI